MLFVLILSALVLGLAGFLGVPAPLTGPAPLLPVDGVSLLAALGLIAAAIGAVLLHRQRLIALILAGGRGAGGGTDLRPVLRPGSGPDPASRWRW